VPIQYLVQRVNPVVVDGVDRTAIHRERDGGTLYNRFEHVTPPMTKRSIMIAEGPQERPPHSLIWVY